jgi:hypothetical protein
MKKAILICGLSMVIISTDAEACSMCTRVTSAWDSFTAWLEKKACESAQFHYKRISGKDGICEHGNKHKANY